MEEKVEPYSNLCKLEEAQAMPPARTTTKDDVLCLGLVRGSGGLSSPLTCRIELTEIKEKVS